MGPGKECVSESKLLHRGEDYSLTPWWSSERTAVVISAIDTSSPLQLARGGARRGGECHFTAMPHPCQSLPSTRLHFDLRVKSPPNGLKRAGCTFGSSLVDETAEPLPSNTKPQRLSCSYQEKGMHTALKKVLLVLYVV